jgi:hypothetical protein
MADWRSPDTPMEFQRGVGGRRCGDNGTFGGSGGELAFIKCGIVRLSILPAAVQNANPLECEGPDGSVMRFASLAVKAVAVAGPISARNVEPIRAWSGE